MALLFEQSALLHGPIVHHAARCTREEVLTLPGCIGPCRLWLQGISHPAGQDQLAENGVEKLVVKYCCPPVRL